MRTGTTPTEPKRGPGRPRKVTPEPTDSDKAKEKLEAKKARVKELQGKLSGEYNDFLLEFYVAQIPQLQPGHLWKSGQAPHHEASTKYTDVGNILSVNDFMATSLAHFAAELEYSDRGQAVTGAVSSGPVGMILWGLMSLASVGMYVKGLKEVMDRLSAIQAAQERMRQAQQQADQGVMQ